MARKQIYVSRVHDLRDTYADTHTHRNAKPHCNSFFFTCSDSFGSSHEHYKRRFGDLYDFGFGSCGGSNCGCL